MADLGPEEGREGWGRDMGVKWYVELSSVYYHIPVNGAACRLYLKCD